LVEKGSHWSPVNHATSARGPRPFRFAAAAGARACRADFAPGPVGIDARLVVELGVTPQISTRVLHASSGAGQIGAGVAHQPLEPFRAALDALVAELDGRTV
jgi:hypothetical protein